MLLLQPAIIHFRHPAALPEWEVFLRFRRSGEPRQLQYSRMPQNSRLASHVALNAQLLLACLAPRATL